SRGVLPSARASWRAPAGSIARRSVPRPAASRSSVLSTRTGRSEAATKGESRRPGHGLTFLWEIDPPLAVNPGYDRSRTPAPQQRTGGGERRAGRARAGGGEGAARAGALPDPPGDRRAGPDARARARVPAHRGAPAHRGRARPGQDPDREDDRRRARRLL